MLHHDRAVTPGDAFLYLPAEKIVITGDLLVNPISFALSSYPTGWLERSRRSTRSTPPSWCPGTASRCATRRCCTRTMDVMRELLKAGKDAKARGLDPDQAREEILPRLQDDYGRDHEGRSEAERAVQDLLVDWYLHRVYDELDGPLTDAIAPIPRK